MNCLLSSLGGHPIVLPNRRVDYLTDEEKSVCFLNVERGGEGMGGKGRECLDVKIVYGDVFGCNHAN